eukprot:gb/GECG01013567.1/.p1 GENE.gb/GECG01013567.1/~~gb/GECG01013567.1/.p1  ORF type:complete len:264 (+),score=27.31 gb/GECG01013567.1/:1-792(+)
MFRKYTIDDSVGDQGEAKDIFTQVYESIRFEQLGKGREGANLVDVATDGETDYVPIVRTTTAYQKPAQQFSQLHHRIRDCINSAVDGPTMTLNNVMAEVYTDDSRKMKFHSDQALDLDPSSYVAIFSCYDKPSSSPRILRIVHKDGDTNENYQDISLEHMTVVVFSVEVNSYHRHKIIQPDPRTNSRWLGLTFRCSQTYIYFDNEGTPRFKATNHQLQLANDEQKSEIIRFKGRENREAFTYPPGITYTLSPHDFQKPTSPVS